MANRQSTLNIPERVAPESEQFNYRWWQGICDLRVAIPGIIQSFDSTEQTVKVKLAVRENINQNGKVVPTEIGVLVDVPILVPRAGGLAVTLPVSAGDECLVVFADMDYQAWWQSGGVQDQVRKRRHDLSDGFALLGPWSQPRVLSNYSTTSLQVRNEAGDVIIDVSDGGVKLKGDLGFFNTTPISKVTVTGSKGGNSALANLLTALANYGLIVNSTT